MTSTPNGSDEGEQLRLSPVREGDMVAGKYVAGAVLGVGGMGVVVQATDRVLERRVAIKFLLPSLATSPKAVQRFIREARLATRITSEHVVRLLEIDTLPNGTPFFAMEFLEGRDLRAVLSERGPLPTAEAVDYVLQALQAIAEGHTYRIVHRDIKPSNLFVTRRADGTPLVKVLDFGIAKSAQLDGLEDFGLTGSGDTRLGSPSYMSPEQLRNPSNVDARSDIWALGVTLYELICGTQPFQGKTYADLVLAITQAQPETPSRRRPDLKHSRGLNQVIMRCLARDSESRYASALELTEALAPFGSDDAKASLRRVKGLITASPMGPSTPASGFEKPANSTVALPLGADPDGTRRSPVVGAVHAGGSARSRLLAIPLGLAILGGLAWLVYSGESSERPSTAQAPESGTELPAPTALATGPSSRVTPAPSLAVPEQPPPEPMPSVSAPPPVVATSRPRPAITAKAPPSAAPVRDAGPPGDGVADMSESVSASAPLPSGRSALIEQLIQKRR